MASPTSQASNSFWTPPIWLIPWISKVQVWLYEKSDGRIGASSAGMRNLLLRTVGRKSGRLNTSCLPYWRDEDGDRIVVASFAGGARHPAWYHNLADTAANPEVVVRDARRVFWASAHVLKGDEYAKVWAQLVVDRPFYTDYQAKTERLIPLVRLVETRPFDG